MKHILFFLIALGGFCYADNPCLYRSVNVISGEYCEAAVDLTYPFNIRRCYSKGGWLCNLPDLFSEAEGVREVPGTGGQKLVYRYHLDGKACLIDSVAAPGKPFCEYKYSSRNLISRTEPNGRYLINEYDESGKVKCQKAPAGSDETPVVVASFIYKENATEAFDALGRKSVYYYTDEGRLTAIETFNEAGLYRKKRFFWKKNLLVSQVLEDGNGAIDHAIVNEYDEKGRLIAQTLYGNLTGSVQAAIVLNEEGVPELNGVESFRKWYVYSEDDKPLLLKEGDDSGLVTRYVYEQFTDWLIAEFTCEGDLVRMRTFYKYDEFGHLLETAVDNGVSELEKDLSGVTERKIIRHKLIDDPDSAAFGKPQFVEERYLNFATGKEEVFSRTVNHYNEQGAVIQKDVLNNDFSLQNSQFMQLSDEGKLTGSSKTDGSAAHFAYDENGNAIAATEGDSHATQRFDFMNRLIGLEKWGSDGEYLSEIYRYDAAGNRVEKTDTFGNRTLYEYDACNRACKVTLPALKNAFGRSYEPVLAFEYDIQDRCTCTTNAGGEKTTKSYNVRGQPLSITYSDGTKELFEYNFDGTLRKSVDATGVATLYQYDYLKRKTLVQVYSKNGALDHETRFHYNTFHLVSTSGSEGSLSIHYNDLGQQKMISQENGVEIEYLYDQKGCIIGTKEWYGDQSDEYRKTYALRDAANQIKEIRMEDAAGRVCKQIASPSREKDSRAQYHYDCVNDEGQNVLTLKETDARGITTVVTFDSLMREDSILKLDPYGEILQKKKIYYDPSGNKAREVHTVVTPGGGSYAYITRCEWGLNRKLLSLTEACGSAKQQSTSYLYNECGQLMSTIKPDGCQLFYEYDDMGRISRLSSSDSTVDYSIVRDAEGRVSEVYDAVQNSGSSKRFDSLGRLAEETLGNGLCLKNEYDRLGRRTLLTLPDNSSIAYEYDAAFLRAVHRYSAEQEKLYTHEYTEYDSMGRLSSENLSGSCGQTHYQRDEMGRCTQFTSPYWKQTLQGFDSAGNLLQMSVEDPLGIEETSFSFDAADQMTGEAGQKEYHFEYDSLQNRCNKNGDIYEIDTLNQLLSTEDAVYSHDANGNIIKKETQHHVYEYGYDALNRLIAVNIDNSATIRYTYDIFNRRLSKQVDEGKAVRFIYDGDCEIGAVDDAGKCMELRVLGIGHGAEIGAACAIELAGIAFVPLHDQRGSVRCLVEMKTQKTAEFYRFNAFGEEELFDENGEELSASANPWRYMSKRCDPETGLIFFGKRYYEPATGRFTTRDPLQFVDGPNRYTYVHNNPLANRDLHGHYSLCEIWENVYSKVADAYDHLYNLSNQGFQAIQKKVDYLNLLREYVDLYSQGMVGDFFFILTGYDAGEAEQGVFGEGEISDKIRITWINGILNVRLNYMSNVKMLSAAHGGNNIHYVFKPSEGWGRDLMAAVISILGFTSPDAKRLAHTWKDLIADMGGVDGGGLIIHYAHSLGGTETYAALHLMTPEQRLRIRVISFGSATMIPSHGMESAVNYLSRCDFMGPVHLIESFIFTDYQINYIGSYFGIPLIDHLLDMDTYSQVVDELGRQFVARYGSHKKS